MNYDETGEQCQVPSNRWLSSPIDPLQYDALYERRAAAGEDIHGEVNFLLSLMPSPSFALLDAGCGTGRIAIEAARRGVRVVGVDLDPRMLARAREKAPHLDWRSGDLETVSFEQTFDLIVLAGNVVICLTPGSETAVLVHLIQFLAPGGLLVAGFATDRDFTLADYDAALAVRGISWQERWATWDRKSWTLDARFAVSVHRRDR
jgi:SAM-dependent methyltransferase